MEVCTSSLPSAGAPAITAKRYWPFHKVAEVFPAFSDKALRWLRYSRTPGFNACTIKIGGRVLVDVDKFELWVESNADVNRDTTPRKPHKPRVVKKGSPPMGRPRRVVKKVAS